MRIEIQKGLLDTHETHPKIRITCFLTNMGKTFILNNFFEEAVAKPHVHYRA
jgi:hypothetical protein